jgi:FAD/FMN-containing dehydrogenase
VTTDSQIKTRSAAVVGPLTPLCGWGRYPTVEGREVVSEDLERATRDVVLTRGLGRSYGDASLPPEGGRAVAGSRLADRVLAFDERTGVLRAEAGLSLHAMNRLFLERGWFTPVSPGTQFVTLGGMVAADVHGKNHHAAGTFGRHVRRLRLRVGGGRVVEVSERDDPELFFATIGGMGLTGHVLEVEVALERVPSPWIWCESEAVPDLETMIDRLVEAGRSWPHTVCWGDFLNFGARGRGLLVKGRWAEADEARAAGPFSWPGSITVPFELPNWALTTPAVRAFNIAYYLRHGGRTRTGLVHPQPFFYPLDAVLHWNRVYGRRGFTQYQCVIPREAGVAAYRELFRTAAAHGAPPYLVVVKDFGAEGRGALSFPRPGITFTLDIPIGDRTQRAVDAMNDLVAEAGGRVYLAKDALSRAEHFRAMEPRLDAFVAVRDRVDPERRLRSALSVRLFGDEP